MPWTAPLKAFASMILEQARLSPQMQEEGYFLCATMDGPRKLVLLRGQPEIPDIDSGFILAFDEDVDETGEVREGAETWKVNVSLISTKDDGRAGHYGEYVKKPD